MKQKFDMNIIILGQQGSGKGAYAQGLVEKYGYIHISTGDLLREEIKKETPIGKSIRDIVNSGKLVSDQIVTKVLENKLKKTEKSFILDGYPRTITQAELLDKILKKLKKRIDLVINLVLKDELSIERIVNRRTCRKCGWVCNLKFMPPRVSGSCDKCGGELYQREDDNEETVRKRLEDYHKRINTIIDYFKKRGILKEIDSNRNYEDVMKDIEKILNERCKG